MARRILAARMGEQQVRAARQCCASASWIPMSRFVERIGSSNQNVVVGVARVQRRAAVPDVSGEGADESDVSPIAAYRMLFAS